MDAPNFVIAELKSDSGQMLTVLTVAPKEFKTGSRGFYANQKVEIGGKRYQLQIQIVEVGSKKKADSENGQPGT